MRDRNDPIRFTFIIPVPRLNDYVSETVEAIQRFPVHDWEVIINTNDPMSSPWDDPRITVINSGRVGPGQKRDQAARIARGDTLIFLDDDSYPEENFLDELSKFRSREIQVVGGPAMTPRNDPFLARVSGAVFLSRLTGGSPDRYMPIGKPRKVLDWPTVNLSIQRELFLRVGGFECRFWPGEDTFLCDKLRECGVDIWYQPSLQVWHHRRPSIRGHLKQVAGYGLHRGFFARHFPSSSRRVAYFLPTLLMIYLIMGLATSAFYTSLLPYFAASILIYLGIVGLGVADAARRSSLSAALVSFPYVVMTHLTYGWFFLRGLLRASPLVSQLR